MKVRDLMSDEVVTLHADSPMVDAEEIMGFRRLRHLPVVDAQKKLVGIITYRDLFRHYLGPHNGQSWIEHQVQKARVKVREIMHQKVESISPDAPLLDAARTIRTTTFGCLPVIDDAGALVGIITEADFVRLADALLAHGNDEQIKEWLADVPL